MLHTLCFVSVYFYNTAELYPPKTEQNILSKLYVMVMGHMHRTEPGMSYGGQVRRSGADLKS